MTIPNHDVLSLITTLTIAIDIVPICDHHYSTYDYCQPFLLTITSITFHYQPFTNQYDLPLLTTNNEAFLALSSIKFHRWYHFKAGGMALVHRKCPA